jgi:hypothetical protein
VLLILTVPGGGCICFIHEEKEVERQCAEVHVVITNPDSWYLCNTRVCDDDVFWHIMCTEHRDYVAVYIVMTCLGI